ncbi:hypothetical protein [Cerasicoccus frondis]|nr:hypothetical protein [Cerasicoccus frondis]
MSDEHSTGCITNTRVGFARSVADASQNSRRYFVLQSPTLGRTVGDA